MVLRAEIRRALIRAGLPAGVDSTREIAGVATRLRGSERELLIATRLVAGDGDLAVLVSGRSHGS